MNMKNNRLFIIILLLNTATKGFSESIPNNGSIRSHYVYFTDTTLNYLSSINLDLYKNKPIDSFLAIIPSNYIGMKVYGHHIAKYADVLAVKYSDKVTIYIHVRQFQFINPRSETMSWDINLFRKENIHHIEIWKAVDCYNGCPYGTPAI